MMSRGIFLTIKNYYLSKGQQTNSQQLLCQEVFKQEINCVMRGFNKCPGVIFQKLVCPGGILKFALLWGCIFIIWNSPLLVLYRRQEAVKKGP